MPEFGYGAGFDLFMFIVPFAVLWVVRKMGVPIPSIGATGFMIVGALCIFTQSVNHRYLTHFEGRDAIVIGMLYIVAAGWTNVVIARNRRRKTRQQSVGGDSGKAAADGGPTGAPQR